MSGFGGFPFGGDDFGGIHVDAPVVADDLLVQPKSAFIGSQLLIASTDGGITDTSRDDNFVSIIDPLRWNIINTGTVTTSVNNGLTVTLHKVMGGSSSTLISTDTYVSGDITLEYDILSEFLSDLPSQELIYSSLQFDFTNATLTIKRKSHVNFNSQSVQAEFRVGGVFSGGGTIVTNQSSGKFRLIKRSNILAALSDDNIVFYTKTNALGDFSVKLISTTSGQAEYSTSKYRLYKSNTGVVLGDTPVYTKNLVTASRILGIVPDSDFVGLVDVYAFNHDGDIGQLLNGFTYPLITGQSLSTNDGFGGSVQGDSTIR